jgi:hypothetical protein
MVEGDRVRLSERVARVFMRRRGLRLDWTKRTGAIISISRTSVNVKWDDRTSLDQWPHAALVVLHRKDAP